MPELEKHRKATQFIKEAVISIKQADAPPLKFGTNKLKDPNFIYTTMGYKRLKTPKPLFLKIYGRHKRVIMNILSMTGTNKFVIPHTNSHYQVYTKA